MTALEHRPGPTEQREPSGKAPAGLAVWVRDLVMGMRFAVGSGREGWVRTALTAVGVGLGVALLLGASSVPNLLANRAERSNARNIEFGEQQAQRSDSSFLFHRVGSQFRGESVDGVLLRPEGGHPALPPGVDKVPGPGEAVVSPALKELLESPDGKLLHDRLPYRVVGTIGTAGLIGPSEYFYYAGSDQLVLKDGNGTNRADTYGWQVQSPGMDPVLMVLILVGCVVLLMPVAIFIATAVRFGGERRDRRLAALRLVGADNHMARRIAAGEALLGSLFGLAVGAGLFLFGRQFIGAVDISTLNAFPSDLSPVPALAVLILLAVPASAVVVTVLALRGIAIEPLGVVRSAVPRRRRLWWRLPIPVIGLVVLAAFGTVDKKTGSVNTYMIGGGAVLTLLGLTMLLPWLVEAVVARFKGGPVPWQLATRRLQLSSSSAARAVSGITVAVAGAIALQMLFTAVGDDYTKPTGQDASRAQLQVMLPARDGAGTQEMIDAFNGTKGVSGVIATINSRVVSPGPERDEGGLPLSTSLTVGSCETLQEIARPGPCRDGDVFLIKGGPGSYMDENLPKVTSPGATVLLNDFDENGKLKGRPSPWALPRTIRPVDARPDPSGEQNTGLFATTGAIDVRKLPDPTARAMVRLDPSVPDAAEHARNTAARIDVTANAFQLVDTSDDRRFVSVRNGLLIASVATMTLIAASMLVTTLEQLRERRRLLSVLVAFGTRRGTLAWSVLWQTAIPMVLGLALAVAGGIGLGRVLLGLADKTGVAWSVVWPLPLFGAGLVLLVTLLSLPPLWRMMRADGLRTE
ncbi:ABC transporter permease [Streptomyces albofaciens JCM 4342]|uniref:ABC transporter permease n=1 Tax=Streptomyces albofaciens TaxID=66866 RepID=UPI001239496A|nr:ABC transporter permease [Streptomyces albofaciens]KAA6214245.1 ABC transporter permease [Streptomyces albofaciens JCM 4342]